MAEDDQFRDVEFQPPSLFVRCMQVARVNQQGLAAILGISDRTLSRWLSGGGGILLADKFHALARAVFPNDRAFAAELAAKGKTTLEALGLVRPPLAPALAPAPLQVQMVSAATLDSIVCAAADLHDLPSRQVRPMVAAAFARAVELGLTAEAVASAFAANSKKA